MFKLTYGVLFTIYIAEVKLGVVQRRSVLWVGGRGAGPAPHSAEPPAPLLAGADPTEEIVCSKNYFVVDG